MVSTLEEIFRYYEGLDEFYYEGEELDLDLDRGSKAGIAKQAQSSPIRYSVAFKSRQSRMAPSPKTAFKGNIYQYNEWRVKDRLQTRTDDPGRQSTAFRSTTRRFKPPPPRLSQSELDAAPQQQDQRAWKRAGWHQSNAPRLHTSTLPRPLTADLDPADPPPSNNVAAAVQPLQQAMAVSPRRVSSMASRESRFVDPGAFAGADPRLRLARPPSSLGPGSYDTAQAERCLLHSASAANAARLPFASKRPRIGADAPSLTPPAGGAALVQDALSWRQGASFMARSPSGRMRANGPQLGSWEGPARIPVVQGRAAVVSSPSSPEMRSPDVSYRVEQSAQKKPLQLEVQASPLRYSPSFRSALEQRPQPDEVRRSLRTPAFSESSFDVADLAGTQFDRSISSRQHSGRASPAFSDRQPRFALDRSDAHAFPAAALVSDQRAWSAHGRTITARADKVTIFAEESLVGQVSDRSPGPQHYGALRDWSPPQTAPHSPNRPRRLLDMLSEAQAEPA